MMRKFRALDALAIILILLLASTAPAAAEEPGDRLTLQGAMDIALREHPIVKEYREKVSAAQYQIGSARAAYLPQVSFTSNFYYGTTFPSGGGAVTAAGGATVPSAGGFNVGLKATEFYANRFSLNQLIYDFGKTPGLIAESRSTFRQTKEDYAGTRQQVVLDARSAYFGYLAGRRAQKVAEENVRQNQELFKQAQGFYKVGLKAKIDVTKAEANLYDAEANLIKAKNAVELTRVSLMTALGLKTWTYKECEDVLEVTPQPRPLGDLKTQAMNQRPEIAKNKYQQDFNLAAFRVARAGWLPTVSSIASYGWVGPRFDFSQDSWWVGVGLTVPMFDGLLSLNNMRTAKANIRATLADAEVLSQNVNKEVEQAYLDVKSGWELIRASKKSLEAARENLRLAWGRYQAGVGTIIEVTDAQVQFAQSDLNYVQALYNYWIFLARLDKAIGTAF